nr:hypothetical protein [Aureimonas ureilytica]
MSHLDRLDVLRHRTVEIVEMGIEIPHDLRGVGGGLKQLASTVRWALSSFHEFFFLETIDLRDHGHRL